MISPDIIARSRDDILAGFGDIGGRSGFDMGTDVAVTIKNTYGLGKQG
jgi:hypothetical protein